MTDLHKYQSSEFLKCVCLVYFLFSFTEIKEMKLALLTTFLLALMLVSVMNAQQAG